METNGCVIVGKCLAQLCAENDGNALTFFATSLPTAVRSASRVMRDASSAHEPVLFDLRRAINDIESLFQLFEQSRDFFGWLLQIVIHRHDYIVFCRANAAEQSIMLAIVAHEIEATHRRVARGEFGDYVPASVPAAVVDQDDLVLERDSRQNFAQTTAQFSDGTFAVVNWCHYGNGTSLATLQR